MRYLIFLQLAFLVLIASCGGGAGGVGSFLAKGDAPAVTSVDFANDQLIINGSNLAGVTSVSVEGEDFDVESISETQLIVNAQQALAFIAGATYNLLVSNAFGAASYSITFTPDNNSITTNMIVDSAITSSKIADEAITESKLSNMGASDGDFLQWDQTTTSWIPTTLNGLTYMGTWDASSGSPPTDPGAGGYYIVSVAGDTDVGTATDPWSVGDWVIRSDTEWQKIDNSNAVTNVFGRQGAITGVEGDYNIDLLGDVDTTTATPTDGQVLSWDNAGGNWVPATESDPKVGTLTNGKWCTTDGNVINCESAPGAETDPIFGAHVAASITDAGSGVVISVAERNGITNNATSISTNATNISSNDSDIATNVTNISTNATNISTNDTDIATNATNISSNDTDIATNVTNISSNDTDIATNVTNISTNATNISSNDTDIAANATAISGKVTAAGKAGGQTIIGGTADNENLTLISSSATPGHILLNPTGGNVGIGTTVPAVKLQTEGTLASYGNQSDVLAAFKSVGGHTSIAIDADASKSTAVKFMEAGAAKWGILRSTTDDSFRFYSYALADSAMAIASNGNVGIGTTAPAAKLDVVGAINAQQLCDENGANCFDLDSGTIAVAGDVSASGGNVSVGTTDATYNITFEGENNQTIGVVEHSSAAGSSLTVNSGSAATGSTDQAGGNLILSSGSATGSGGSAIEFKTATSGASGTVTATPSTKMVITEAGHVGIGTTAPTVSLHIQDTAPQILVERYNNIAYGPSINLLQNRAGAASQVGDELGYLNFKFIDSALNTEWGAEITSNVTNITDGSETADLEFRTRNAGATNKAMRILGSGYVGIGTTSPQRPLHVATGSIMVGDDTTNTLGGVIVNHHNDNSSSTAFLGKKSRAGATTQNGDTIIEFRGDAHDGTDFTTAASIRLAVDGTPSAGVVPGMIKMVTADDAGVLTTQMVVKSNGNVGIGTTSPTVKLHSYDEVDGVLTGLVIDNRKVYGGGTGTNEVSRIALSLSEGGATDPLDRVMGYVSAGTLSETASGGGFLALGTRTSGTETEKVRIDNNGNVGIGTTAPAAKLDVLGNFRVNSTTFAAPAAGKGVEIHYDSGADMGYIYAYDRDTPAYQNLGLGNGASQLFLKSDGNVGIGTTDPTNKLHVSGEHQSGYKGNVGISFKGGANSTVGASGITINPKTNNDNYTGDNYSFISMLSRSSNLSNTGHSGGAIIVSKPGANNTTYGSADLNFYLRNDTAPYTFDGDPSTDPGSWMTNPVMTMRSTGNVGVGTTSPNAKLEIVGAGDDQLTLNTVSDAADTSLRFRENDVTRWKLYSEAASNDLYLVDDGGVNLMTWDTINWNVGMGTLTPEAAVLAGNTRALDITDLDGGEIVIDHTDAGTTSDLGLISFARSNDPLAYIRATVDGAIDSARLAFATQPTTGVLTERLTIKSDGNVGVGNTNPGYKLEVNGTDGEQAVTIGNDNFASNNGRDGSLHIKSDSSTKTATLQSGGSDSKLQFNVNNSGTTIAAMHIKEDGNVGIGTTDPITDLDVNGSIKVNSRITNWTSGCVEANPCGGMTVTAATLTGLDYNQVRWGTARIAVMAYQGASCTSYFYTIYPSVTVRDSPAELYIGSAPGSCPTASYKIVVSY